MVLKVEVEAEAPKEVERMRMNITKNGTPKKQILCKYVKEGKPCPQGKACLFGHRRKNFDSAGQYIQRQAPQESKAQGSNDQWESPVGLRNAAVVCIIKMSPRRESRG